MIDFPVFLVGAVLGVVFQSVLKNPVDSIGDLIFSGVIVTGLIAIIIFFVALFYKEINNVKRVQKLMYFKNILDQTISEQKTKNSLG